VAVQSRVVPTQGQEHSAPHNVLASHKHPAPTRACSQGGLLTGIKSTRTYIAAGTVVYAAPAWHQYRENLNILGKCLCIIIEALKERSLPYWVPPDGSVRASSMGLLQEEVHLSALPPSGALWPCVRANISGHSPRVSPESTSTYSPAIGWLYSAKNSPNFRRPVAMSINSVASWRPNNVEFSDCHQAAPKPPCVQTTHSRRDASVRHHFQ